tara:strand:+ start:31831 stop:32757 length:927 start_codon:yes stop_codon:yes gene_type:complete
MSFISYSQNFEDVILWRALKNVENGFYIDIGANDPVDDSVTKSFYDRGWTGINCEPVQHWFSKLKAERNNDINLQVAIGAQTSQLEFFEIVNTGLSTLDKTLAKKHSKEYGFELKSYVVPVEKLTSICEREKVDVVHFLKVDVEGAEKAVLEGIDFKRIRPWIVVVEATKPMSQEVDYDQWEFLITSENYHFVYFDGLNRFYVANEHDELDYHFDRPPNIFDQFVLFSQVKAEIKATEAEIKATEAEIKATEAEEKAYKAKKEVTEAEIKMNDALRCYSDVINSRSWVITKPLRNMVQRLKLIIGKSN